VLAVLQHDPATDVVRQLEIRWSAFLSAAEPPDKAQAAHCARRKGSLDDGYEDAAQDLCVIAGVQVVVRMDLRRKDVQGFRTTGSRRPV
jgi:hypothetical protein